jgi:hypothetical protein
MVFSKELVVNLFMIVIYIIILDIFDKARKKFAGGMLGRVITLIIVSTTLMLISDYAPLLNQVIPLDIVYIITVLFRVAALAVLAFGGLRLISI